jgi:hypothetical protein
VLHCPCGAEREPRDLSDVLSIPTERQEEDTPAPTLTVGRMVVYIAHGELSTGESGRPSVLERERLLSLMGITDPAEIDVWWRLWGAITDAQVREDRRRLDRMSPDAKGGGDGG